MEGAETAVGGDDPAKGEDAEAVETTLQHKTAGVPAAAEDIMNPRNALITTSQKDKQSFLDWENADHTNNEKDEKNDNISHCGPGLAVSPAVHAVLCRNFLRSRKARASTKKSATQICNFRNQHTTSRKWQKNPLPSFWVGVPSGAVLCFRCFQRRHRGSLPPEQEVQDAPT